MRSRENGRTLFVGVLCLLICLFSSSSGRATDGRDFAGFYEVANAVDLGTDYQIALSVRVFNFSDATVRNATITVQDSLSGVRDFGAFSQIASLADRNSVRLSSTFTIPNDEYERWQGGGTPSLRIDYTDAAEHSVRRVIELTQIAVGEE